MIARIALALIFIGLIGLMERHQPVAYFRGLIFFFAFCLLAYISSLLRSWRREVLLVATSLALALCLIEAGAYVFEPRHISILTAGLNEPKPIIGAGPSYAGTYHEEKIDRKSGARIFSADYTIDSVRNLNCSSS